MQEPKKHHSVPAFYLARWAGEDGKVCVVRNFEGKIARSFLSPENTGFEPHLYSYPEEFPAKNRAEIETNYFSRLDNEGAKIVEKIINGEERSEEERILWAVFLSAMWIRTPKNVDWIKKMATGILIQKLEDGQNEYQEFKDDEDPERFLDWVELKNPGLINAIGVGQIPKLASNQKIVNSILEFSWYAVSFENSPKPLLTSDTPCIFTERLEKPGSIIALPLSPKCAFIAFRPNSHAQSGLMKMSSSRLSAALNDDITRQARERVYCKSPADAPDNFFQKRLASSLPSD